MFDALNRINKKPEPFECYTRLELWNDEHISKGMLEAHLDPFTDWASRNRTFMDKSINWIISHFNIGKSSVIIDFGCGPGLYTIGFAEAGASVTGLDFSERSIDYARQRARDEGLGIDYILQDYLEFSSEKKFDLITMIWCDYSALSPNQRSILLGLFHDLLTDNGSILIDVDSIHRFKTTALKKTEYEYFPVNGFFSSGPHHVFSCKHKYESKNLLLDKQTIIAEDRELELYHWAQCFSLETLSNEFRESGLHIVESYSDVAGSPFREDSDVIAIVAKKVK